MIGSNLGLYIRHILTNAFTIIDTYTPDTQHLVL